MGVNDANDGKSYDANKREQPSSIPATWLLVAAQSQTIARDHGTKHRGCAALTTTTTNCCVCRQTDAASSAATAGKHHHADGSGP